MTTVPEYINCELFPLTSNNGQGANTLYAKGCAFISRLISVRLLPPPPPSETRSATLIVTTDPHTAKGTLWLAIHLQPRSYSAFFDSYGFLPLVPNILTFYALRAPYGNKTRRSCKAWPVWFAAIIAVYSHSTWTAGTLLKFVGLFDATTADRQINRFFASEFGPLRTARREGQGCAPATSIRRLLSYL